MEHTIKLTEAQYKALSYVAYDPQEWIENAVNVRCERAMEEIFLAECQRIALEGGEISGTKEEIVANAVIKTAKERQDESVAASSSTLTE
jgi:hypothetical protein